MVEFNGFVFGSFPFIHLIVRGGLLCVVLYYYCCLYWLCRN
jgi:hypothetical protein